MYKAGQSAGEDTSQGPEPGAEGSSKSDDEVTDVDFEEVK